MKIIRTIFVKEQYTVADVAVLAGCFHIGGVQGFAFLIVGLLISASIGGRLK
jgi:hypothetical protein